MPHICINRVWQIPAQRRKRQNHFPVLYWQLAQLRSTRAKAAPIPSSGSDASFKQTVMQKKKERNCIVNFSVIIIAFIIQCDLPAVGGPNLRHPCMVKVCMWQGSRQAQFAPSNWLLQEVPCCSYCHLPYSFRAQSLRATEWLLPQGIHLSSYNGLSPNHWWSCRNFSLTFVLKGRMKTHSPQPYPVHNEIQKGGFFLTINPFCANYIRQYLC